MSNPDITIIKYQHPFSPRRKEYITLHFLVVSISSLSLPRQRGSLCVDCLTVQHHGLTVTTSVVLAAVGSLHQQHHTTSCRLQQQ